MGEKKGGTWRKKTRKRWKEKQRRIRRGEKGRRRGKREGEEEEMIHMKRGGGGSNARKRWQRQEADAKLAEVDAEISNYFIFVILGFHLYHNIVIPFIDLI